jgi:hypothetical protein
MTNTRKSENICAEGDDVPDDDSRPIAVVLFGSSFAATADEKMGRNISVSGHNAVARLAEHLLATGHDKSQEMTLYRGGVFIAKTTVGHAAKSFT